MAKHPSVERQVFHDSITKLQPKQRCCVDVNLKSNVKNFTKIHMYFLTFKGLLRLRGMPKQHTSNWRTWRVERIRQESDKLQRLNSFGWIGPWIMIHLASLGDWLPKAWGRNYPSPVEKCLFPSPALKLFQSKHKLSAISGVLKCSKPTDMESLGVTSTTSPSFSLPLLLCVSSPFHQWALTQGKLHTSWINSSPKSWVLIFSNGFTNLLDT